MIWSFSKYVLVNKTHDFDFSDVELMLFWVLFTSGLSIVSVESFVEWECSTWERSTMRMFYFWECSNKKRIKIFNW